mmetsp:Transcript_43877/g.124246  ORF Transcript_43877/g.124246 Transcript_43877/m.124246 type:complete len:301 (-) Transcript_43877:726-1628(-)
MARRSSRILPLHTARQQPPAHLGGAGAGALAGAGDAAAAGHAHGDRDGRRWGPPSIRTLLQRVAWTRARLSRQMTMTMRVRMRMRTRMRTQTAARLPMTDPTPDMASTTRWPSSGSSWASMRAMAAPTMPPGERGSRQMHTQTRRRRHHRTTRRPRTTNTSRPFLCTPSLSPPLRSSMTLAATEAPTRAMDGQRVGHSIWTMTTPRKKLRAATASTTLSCPRECARPSRLQVRGPLATWSPKWRWSPSTRPTTATTAASTILTRSTRRTTTSGHPPPHHRHPGLAAAVDSCNGLWCAAVT